MGSDVVYLAGRGVRAATMTPYDVAALRLSDGLDLAGTPPNDAERYLAAVRASPGACAAALTRGGLTTATDLAGLVEGLVGVTWAEAVADARGAGALLGVSPADGAEG